MSASTPRARNAPVRSYWRWCLTGSSLPRPSGPVDDRHVDDHAGLLDGELAGGLGVFDLADRAQGAGLPRVLPAHDVEGAERAVVGVAGDGVEHVGLES